MKYDVIIIGGGPAGLFSAINIKNKRVLILEKNELPGRKLLMAGAGRCNITHSGEIEEFLHHYGDNSKFLKTALKKFTNTDVIDFFLTKGMETITDKNGKIFPATEKSKDILDILLQECEVNKVVLKCSTSVLKVEKIGGGYRVITKNGEFEAATLIIATGGNSYGTTGSSGDGYSFAKMLGHTIERVKPSLTPIFINDYKFTEISGVSLHEREITLYRNGKKIRRHSGDIGFTHTGISGPGILDFSRYLEEGDLIKINMVGVNNEEIKENFIAKAASDGSQTIKRFLRGYDIPESLGKIIIFEAGIEQGEQLANIDKKRRNYLSELLSEYPFEIEKIGDFNMAMATKGGVTLSEINSKTMESKLCKNLYFAGEVIDIDGDTGGYNIQAAFSTGYLAAESISEKI